MKIRRYLIGEERELLSLLFNTVHRVNRRDYTQAQVDAWVPADYDQQAWVDRLSKTQPWVAVQGDEILGFAEMDDMGRIGCFYIHHDRLGQGVGTALLESIEAESLRLGIHRLQVEASVTARDFFQSKGFSLVRRQTVERRGESFVNYQMKKDIG
ncbi:MAG: GNAT family N-acetyltransferase [Candidatus Thiodiazotropha sp. (ex Monitilora ramsayi)]|nr:GNAT family N-acetyltransferase [Candidatus Thiodiazotropha sp. (ex Monitilora ramsayi)]